VPGGLLLHHRVLPTNHSLTALLVAGALALPGCRHHPAPAEPACAPGPPRAAPTKPTPFACGHYGAPEIVGHFPADVIDEGSGLVASRVNPGIVWLHNDSGDGPNLYAVTTKGRLLGHLVLDGVEAIDMEDIADGPCPAKLGSPWCLYAGDIGDNRARRDHVTVYAVPEPRVATTCRFGTSHVTHFDSFPARYPGGARDSEGLAVTPGGRMFIVSKGRKRPPTVWAYPKAPVPGTMSMLAKVFVLDTGKLGGGPPPLHEVTAAALDPVGRRLLLRTYPALFELSLSGPLSADTLKTATWTRVPVGSAPQGEAVGWLPDGTGYLAAGEQVGDLWRVGCGKPR